MKSRPLNYDCKYLLYTDIGEVEVHGVMYGQVSPACPGDELTPPMPSEFDGERFEFTLLNWVDENGKTQECQRWHGSDFRLRLMNAMLDQEGKSRWWKGAFYNQERQALEQL